MSNRIGPDNRRGFLRSAVAGSMLMPGILHELLAADTGRPGRTEAGRIFRARRSR